MFLFLLSFPLFSLQSKGEICMKPFFSYRKWSWKLFKAAWCRGVGSLFVAGGILVGCSKGSTTESEAVSFRARLREAPKLRVENLCQPIRTTRRGRLLWAPNPDGKTWDLLQIYFPDYGGPTAIVLLDLGSGTQKIIQIPSGWNFHLCPGSVSKSVSVRRQW